MATLNDFLESAYEHGKLEKPMVSDVAEKWFRHMCLLVEDKPSRLVEGEVRVWFALEGESREEWCKKHASEICEYINEHMLRDVDNFECKRKAHHLVLVRKPNNDA
jgi:hypothetical protein